MDHRLSDSTNRARLLHQLYHKRYPLPGKRKKYSTIAVKDLFYDPSPSRDILQRFNALAKSKIQDAQTPQERDVYAALYYTTIALAYRAGYDIDPMEPQDLRKGYHWMINQSWIDPRTKELFLL